MWEWESHGECWKMLFHKRGGMADLLELNKGPALPYNTVSMRSVPSGTVDCQH